MRTLYAFLSCSILACLGLTTAPSAQAQEVIYDSVVLGEGNANMSFYSLANGELAQVPLADWHIALDVRAMGSTARINGGLGLKRTRTDRWPNGTMWTSRLGFLANLTATTRRTGPMRHSAKAATACLTSDGASTTWSRTS